MPDPKKPSSIAADLRLVASAIDSIARDLDRAPEGYEWTVESARHFVERIGNVETLLGEAKLDADNAKRAALAARARRANA